MGLVNEEDSNDAFDLFDKIFFSRVREGLDLIEVRERLYETHSPVKVNLRRLERRLLDFIKGLESEEKVLALQRKNLQDMLEDVRKEL